MMMLTLVNDYLEIYPNATENKITLYKDGTLGFEFLQEKKQFFLRNAASPLFLKSLRQLSSGCSPRPDYSFPDNEGMLLKLTQASPRDTDFWGVQFSLSLIGDPSVAWDAYSLFLSDTQIHSMIVDIDMNRPMDLDQFRKELKSFYNAIYYRSPTLTWAKGWFLLKGLNEHQFDFYTDVLIRDEKIILNGDLIAKVK